MLNFAFALDAFKQLCFKRETVLHTKKYVVNGNYENILTSNRINLSSKIIEHFALDYYEIRFSKRTRNSERTRNHILEKAFDEIYRQGFQGVSIDKIVENTQLTKGAFYHHFPTKNNLGYALVDESLREMISEQMDSSARRL